MSLAHAITFNGNGGWAYFEVWVYFQEAMVQLACVHGYDSRSLKGNVSI